MRYINDEGIELIKKFEGFAEKPYYCPAGILTIGYGHIIKEGEDFSNGITEDEASNMLKKELITYCKAVEKLFKKTPLNDNQFSALVSFAYNLGTGALQRSTLRRKIRRGEYHAAPKEFRKWVFAGGKKLKGLILRREAEIALFIRQDTERQTTAQT